MEFHVRTARRLPGLSTIEAALVARDPAAVVDMHPVAGLRVGAAIDIATLVALLNRAGGEVAPGDVEPQPSVCCGGCGG